MRNTSAIGTFPQSWAVQDWPPDIYPGSPSRGKYVTRMHREELLAVGALARVGRDLVVIGGPYNEWLAEQTQRVADFLIAPNRTPLAHGVQTCDSADTQKDKDC